MSMSPSSWEKDSLVSGVKIRDNFLSGAWKITRKLIKVILRWLQALGCLFLKIIIVCFVFVFPSASVLKGKVFYLRFLKYKQSSTILFPGNVPCASLHYVSIIVISQASLGYKSEPSSSFLQLRGHLSVGK